MGRDSSVGVATHYGLDGPGIEIRCEVKCILPIQTGTVACTELPDGFPSGKVVLSIHPYLSPGLKKE